MSEMANTKERSGEFARIAIAALKYLSSLITLSSQTDPTAPRCRLCLMK